VVEVAIAVAGVVVPAKPPVNETVPVTRAAAQVMESTLQVLMVYAVCI
jgi:hypothetical protein